MAGEGGEEEGLKQRGMVEEKWEEGKGEEEGA